MLKDWIETSFTGNCEVFVSSDDGDIQLGELWPTKIDDALSQTDVVLILASPRSIGRPWINFEAGCGWTRQKAVIPVCHSGLGCGELPKPYSNRQAIDLADKDFAKKLITDLSRKMNIKKPPRVDFSAMRDELLAALMDETSSTLPDSKSESTSLSQIISNEQEKVLILLVEYSGRITENKVSQRLSVSAQKACYLLEQLVKFSLVDDEISYGTGPTSYYLSTKGREYLAQRDLL